MEIQEYLSIDAEQQVRVRDDLPEAFVEIEPDSEIMETYKASVLRLENSVFKAIKLGRLMQKYGYPNWMVAVWLTKIRN